LPARDYPTKWREFQAIGFQQEICNGVRRLETAVALVLGEVSGTVPLLYLMKLLGRVSAADSAADHNLPPPPENEHSSVTNANQFSEWQWKRCT
jgi:hypothetical protein